MKKLLLAFFVVASVHSFAQSWAAPGATWYYSYQTFMPMTTGYERIQNIGDTIISGRQYNKLQIYREWYDQQNQMTISYTVPQLEFTRADSGVVYYYRDSADYVLYDFNAQPGDMWVLRNEFEGTPCDTASVVVDSIATTIINGDTLRVLRTSPVNWSGITLYYPRIIEKIGSLANLFPYTMCITDIPQGYGLRCYTDSTGWMYQDPNWNSACDYIMDVNTQPVQEPFSMNYNPLLQSITLNGPQINGGTVVRIYDSRGRLVQEQVISASGTAEISFSGEAGGMYFVSVTSDTFTGSRAFIAMQ